jgi:mRNA interferase RelE/StbE
MYKIEILSSADKSLKKINAKDRITIARAIDRLSENPTPHGYKKLQNSEFYRIRIGDYRVIYQIQNNELIVVIIRIGHRKEIYKK